MNALDIQTTRGGRPLASTIPAYSREALLACLSVDEDTGAPCVAFYDQARAIYVYTQVRPMRPDKTMLFAQELPLDAWRRSIDDEDVTVVPHHIAAALAPLFYDWLEAPTPELASGIVEIRRSAEGRVVGRCVDMDGPQRGRGA